MQQPRSTRRGGMPALRGPAWPSIVLLALAAAPCAAGQETSASSFDSINPITVLEEASAATPSLDGDLTGALNILLLLTVLTLAPAILILCTCFTRIVITLGLLRQALGTQGLPPSQVLVGLSLFVTIVVMAPTFERIYQEGVEPYASGAITDPAEAWQRARQPLRDFMFAQIEATGNWSGVYMILNYRGFDTSDPASIQRADVDLLTLVPAFILSELKVAFLIGFRIFLPFLVIDMVIASLLISMGMLMLPPMLISMPFKLLLFVLVDGWQLVVGTLMTSVVQPEETVRIAAAALGAGP
jgi:flagellar biosynthetic protein FliP